MKTLFEKFNGLQVGFEHILRTVRASSGNKGAVLRITFRVLLTSHMLKRGAGDISFKRP